MTATIATAVADARHGSFLAEERRIRTSDGEQLADLLTAEEIALIGEVSRQIGWEACAAAFRDAGVDMALEASRSVWRRSRYGELAEQRRVTHEPCVTGCGRCSRCVHAEAWRARGGRYFLGVEHETARTDGGK